MAYRRVDRGPRRKGRMETVGDLVGKVLGDLGLDGVAVAHRIGSQWDEIPFYAEYTLAHGDRRGI